MKLFKSVALTLLLTGAVGSASFAGNEDASPRGNEMEVLHEEMFSLVFDYLEDKDLVNLKLASKTSKISALASKSIFVLKSCDDLIKKSEEIAFSHNPRVHLELSGGTDVSECLKEENYAALEKVKSLTLSNALFFDANPYVELAKKMPNLLVLEVLNWNSGQVEFFEILKQFNQLQSLTVITEPKPASLSKQIGKTDSPAVRMKIIQENRELDRRFQNARIECPDSITVDEAYNINGWIEAKILPNLKYLKWSEATDRCDLIESDLSAMWPQLEVVYFEENRTTTVNRRHGIHWPSLINLKNLRSLTWLTSNFFGEELVDQIKDQPNLEEFTYNLCSDQCQVYKFENKYRPLKVTARDR
jgi:hypothetical protein